MLYASLRSGGYVVSLNRREVLRLGAMGAAGLVLSSSAANSSLEPVSLILNQSGGPTIPPASLPVRPQASAAPAGIDPQLFARAKAALDQHHVWATDSIGIADFSKPSNEPRFHVVNLQDGTVESHLVCHGRGSD